MILVIKILGLLLLALVIVVLILFIFFLSVEIIIRLLRKTSWGMNHLKPLKPLAIFHSPCDNRGEANNGSEEVNIPNYIESLVRQFLLFWCPIKRPSHNSQPIKSYKNPAKNGCDASDYNNSPEIVNNPTNNRVIQGYPILMSTSRWRRVYRRFRGLSTETEENRLCFLWRRAPYGGWNEEKPTAYRSGLAGSAGASPPYVFDEQLATPSTENKLANGGEILLHADQHYVVMAGSGDCQQLFIL